MEKIFYAKLNKETGIVDGFYVEEVNGKEVCEEVIKSGGIAISEELWQELVSYGRARADVQSLSTVAQAIPEGESFCFSMEHSKHFSRVENKQDNSLVQPMSLEVLNDKINKIEDRLEQIILALNK